jgi:hypothetical protein
VSEKQITSANARLKSAKTGVTIEAKGDRLTLRATLPPKPSSGKDKPYQQRIYLGWYANPAGIKRAEAEAHKISENLLKDKFTWADYQEIEAEPAQTVTLPIVSELVERFKVDTANSDQTNYRSSKLKLLPKFSYICQHIPLIYGRKY